MLPVLLSDKEVDELKYNPNWEMHKGRCPTCDGTGHYIDARTEVETFCMDDDYGHPQLRLFKLYCNANIPPEYQILDWDEYPHADTKEKVDEYTSHLDGALHWGMGWFIYGKDKGVGKTWAATQILKEAVKQNYGAFFSTFADFKESEWDKTEYSQWRLRKMRTANFLVIDDVKEPISDKQGSWYQDLLEHIVRFRTQHQMPIILTTNIESVDEFYPNLMSMFDGHLKDWHISGEDYRGTLYHLKEEALLNNYRLPLM